MVRTVSVGPNDKEQKNKQQINRSKASGEKNRQCGEKKASGGDRDSA